MKNFACCLGLSTMLVTLSSASADTEIPDFIICSAAEILECLPVQSCQRVSAESVGAPHFLRVNFADGLISRTPVGGEERISPIERAEELEGRLVLQGAEDGVEGTRGGLGWTLSIDKHSGDMVLTGSGDGVGFVIFGACMAP